MHLVREAQMVGDKHNKSLTKPDLAPHFVELACSRELRICKAELEEQNVFPVGAPL